MNALLSFPCLSLVSWLLLTLTLSSASAQQAQPTPKHPCAADRITSLTNPDVKFTPTDKHFVVLKRGKITAIIVDNSAVDTPELPKHSARYSGVASLSHADNPRNIFIGAVSGLNFEHIHVGTNEGLKSRFEPRDFPMHLRLIDEHTVELHQPPTGNFKLESCGRYHLLEDGTIEYTFECIPREPTFSKGFIGLFWASYIDRPEDKAIHFLGRKTSEPTAAPTWLTTTSPKHGVESTHPPAGKLHDALVDPDFTLTLVPNRSQFLHTSDWYYGLSHGLAYSQMFRHSDQIWFAQSPTGGGDNNPAWDFQWFIPNYHVGEAYGFTMRASCFPFKDRQSLESTLAPHLRTLNPN